MPNSPNARPIKSGVRLPVLEFHHPLNKTITTQNDRLMRVTGSGLNNMGLLLKGNTGPLWNGT
jgi:hypothetical protein